MRASRPAVLAAILLVAEGIALGAVSIVELVQLGSGAASSTPSGLALVVITLLAAAALVLFAVGILRRVSWARSGAIVFQVLAIALSLSALTLQPINWTFVLALGLPGIAGLVLVIMAAVRDGAARPAPED